MSKKHKNLEPRVTLAPRITAQQGTSKAEHLTIGATFASLPDDVRAKVEEANRPMAPHLDLSHLAPPPTNEGIAVAMVNELDRRNLTIRKDATND